MKIDHGETFLLNEIIWKESILVPTNEGDAVAKEFIKCYQSNNWKDVVCELRGTKVTVTIALCNLEEKDNWKIIAKELQKDGWSGASLTLWQLYVQGKKDVGANNVTLAGVRYRDEQFVEWVPIVHYTSRLFLKSATEISMKLSSTLNLAKARTILIAKTNVLKT